DHCNLHAFLREEVGGREPYRSCSDNYYVSHFRPSRNNAVNGTSIANGRFTYPVTESRGMPCSWKTCLTRLSQVFPLHAPMPHRVAALMAFRSLTPICTSSAICFLL